MTTYLVVTPRYTRRVTSIPAACRVARLAEQRAREAHGPQAGADCYLVRDTDGVLEGRGLIMGRRVVAIGHTAELGRQRAAEAVAIGTVRA